MGAAQSEIDTFLEYSITHNFEQGFNYRPWQVNAAVIKKDTELLAKVIPEDEAHSCTMQQFYLLLHCPIRQFR